MTGSHRRVQIRRFAPDPGELIAGPRRLFCGRTRREFLWEIGGGFGSVALAGMLGDGFLGRQAVAADGVTAVRQSDGTRKSSLPAKARA